MSTYFLIKLPNGAIHIPQTSVLWVSAHAESSNRALFALRYLEVRFPQLFSAMERAIWKNFLLRYSPHRHDDVVAGNPDPVSTGEV